jgi:lipopolysaccharide transport system ATP-binding protein
MQDVSKGEGRTVLFVSHNMAAVRSLCNKGVVLENGKNTFNSNIESTIEYYLNRCKAEEKQFDFDSRIITNKQVFIKNFEIENQIIDNKNYISFNNPLCCKIQIKANESISFTARITIFDVNENRIIALDSSEKGEIFNIQQGEEITIACKTQDALNIKPGMYRVNVSIKQGNNLLDHIIGAANFEIIEEDFFGCGRYNSCEMPIILKHHQWDRYGK